jgi:hypothetical protein
MNYQYVAFVPVRGRIKVFTARNYFCGYLEPRDLVKIFNAEENAVYDAGQVAIILDYDKVKPFLQQPWKQ